MERAESSAPKFSDGEIDVIATIYRNNDLSESAGKVPEECRRSAGKVPEKCRRSAGGVPEELVNGHLKVYNFVRENGCVTAAEAEKLLGVKSRRARKVLKGLVEGKWLEKVGASSSTRYVVQR